MVTVAKKSNSYGNDIIKKSDGFTQKYIKNLQKSLTIYQKDSNINKNNQLQTNRQK